MKPFFILALAILQASSAYGQWMQVGNTHVYSFGAIDTNLFASIQYPSGNQTVRFDRSRSYQYAFAADTGLQGAKIVQFDTIANYIFACSDAGVVFGSSNLGGRWKSMMAVGPIATNGSYLFATDNITGTDPHIRSSKDLGTTWQEVLDVPTKCIAGNGACIFVVNGNTIWRSQDSGNRTTWDSINSPIKGIQSFVFLGSVALGTNQEADGGLVRSVDSGSHWDPLPFTHRVFAFAKAESTLFAGTDSGVFLSSDFGTSWRSVGDGLPVNSYVEKVFVFDTLVFIGGYSGDTHFSYYRPLREILPPKSSVQSLESQDTISIYPNPTLSSIRIDFGSAAVRRVELLDVLGASKQVVAPRESSLTLDLAPLPSGTYFLRFETAMGIHMRKIVKE